MSPNTSWTALKNLLRTEWQHLTTVNASNRLWQMPLAAALASGLPLLIGAAFNQLTFGLVASLGGLVFLYLPNTPLYHRMVLLMTCAFAMAACYTLGLMSHFAPLFMVPVLMFIAILVSMLCRFYALGGPGSLFFIMVASIGAYTPLQVLQVPLMVGLLIMGSLLATLIAFFYSIYTLRLREPDPITPMPIPTFDFVIFDSVIIGVFVGISLALAQVLHLQKAYWVPISCLAVIQGASLRAIWNKQVHRVLGTGIGLLAAWSLLLWLPMDKWSICLAIMILTFVIETVVVRHYAFAVVFITPLTILLAETVTLGHSSPAALIQARFIDTILGCFVGLIGGICLHNPHFRTVVSTPMRWLIPDRFVQ